MQIWSYPSPASNHSMTPLFWHSRTFTICPTSFYPTYFRAIPGVLYSKGLSSCLFSHQLFTPALTHSICSALLQTHPPKLSGSVTFSSKPFCIFQDQSSHSFQRTLPSNKCSHVVPRSLIQGTKPLVRTVRWLPATPTVTCHARCTWVFLHLEPPCLYRPGIKPFPVTVSTMRRKPLLGTKLLSAYAAQGGQLPSEVSGCCEQLWSLTSCCEQITLSPLGDYTPCSPVFLSSTCVTLTLSNAGRIHLIETRADHASYPPTPRHQHRHTHTLWRA